MPSREKILSRVSSLDPWWMNRIDQLVRIAEVEVEVRLRHPQIYQKVLDRADEVIGRGRLWLCTPSLGLNARIPVEILLKSPDSVDDLMQELGRIEFGVYL